MYYISNQYIIFSLIMRFLLVSVDDPKISHPIEVPEAITVRKSTYAKSVQRRVKSTTSKVHSQVKLKKKQLSRAIVNHGHSRDKQRSRSG